MVRDFGPGRSPWSGPSRGPGGPAVRLSGGDGGGSEVVPDHTRDGSVGVGGQARARTGLGVGAQPDQDFGQPFGAD